MKGHVELTSSDKKCLKYSLKLYVLVLFEFSNHLYQPQLQLPLIVISWSPQDHNDKQHYGEE